MWAHLASTDFPLTKSWYQISFRLLKLIRFLPAPPTFRRGLFFTTITFFIVLHCLTASSAIFFKLIIFPRRKEPSAVNKILALASFILSAKAPAE